MDFVPLPEDPHRLKGFKATERRHAYGEIFGIFIGKKEFQKLLRDATLQFTVLPEPISRSQDPTIASQLAVVSARIQAEDQAKLVSEIDRYRLGATQTQFEMMNSMSLVQQTSQPEKRVQYERRTQRRSCLGAKLSRLGFPPEVHAPGWKEACAAIMHSPNHLWLLRAL